MTSTFAQLGYAKTAEQKMLDAKLPTAHDRPLYEQKCARVYNHMYEKYLGDGRSVYAGVG